MATIQTKKISELEDRSDTIKRDDLFIVSNERESTSYQVKYDSLAEKLASDIPTKTGAYFIETLDQLIDAEPDELTSTLMKSQVGKDLYERIEGGAEASSFVTLAGNQNITGRKNFTTEIPTVSIGATAGNHVVNLSTMEDMFQKTIATYVEDIKAFSPYSTDYEVLSSFMVTNKFKNPDAAGNQNMYNDNENDNSWLIKKDYSVPIVLYVPYACLLQIMVVGGSTQGKIGIYGYDGSTTGAYSTVVNRIQTAVKNSINDFILYTLDKTAGGLFCESIPVAKKQYICIFQKCAMAASDTVTVTKWQQIAERTYNNLDGSYEELGGTYFLNENTPPLPPSNKNQKWILYKHTESGGKKPHRHYKSVHVQTTRKFIRPLDQTFSQGAVVTATMFKKSEITEK